MNQEQKKIFYRNILKFIVGIVLLTISYGYIQNHPAEKVSIVSGFQVMYERAQVLVYDILGRDSSTLRQKHQINQYYQELIRLAESRSCVTPELFSQILETYQAFSQQSISELSDSIAYFSLRASEFDGMIKDICQ